jgi:hypothetical protein
MDRFCGNWFWNRDDIDGNVEVGFGDIDVKWRGCTRDLQ